MGERWSYPAREPRRHGVIRRHAKAWAVGTALAVLTAAGIGVAAWLVGGGGSAYTKAGQTQALTTVDVSASVTEALFPSDTGDALIRISNPNGTAVTVTDVTGSGPITDLTQPGCDLTGTISFADVTGASLVVPAGGAATFTLTNAVTTTGGFPNCVQGDSIEIPVSLSGTLG